jgi:hypothetical protein
MINLKTVLTWKTISFTFSDLNPQESCTKASLLALSDDFSNITMD